MLTHKPSEVRLIEVAPRDGLQNEKKVIATADKFEFIQRLAKAGLRTIEVTSFVRPDRVAQMSDAKALYALCAKAQQGQSPLTGVRLPCLVPNLKGLEQARLAGVTEVAVFTATSETFNQHNINATIKESMERIKAVCLEAQKHKMRIRGYVSTVFGCPYEGATSLKRALAVSEELLSFGVTEVSLGDTIGVGNPEQVLELCREFSQHLSLDLFSLHFHDTWGRALANVLAGLEGGVRAFDASAGGLGGCPYARGATGNVAMEDVVDFLHQLGIQTGVDFDLLCEASVFMGQKLGASLPAKALNAHLGLKAAKGACS
jgi:hydroxymethylglutaryl-CoA lyase